MHRILVNEAIIKLTIRPDGPILVKAGEGMAGIHPELPDMAFVRTFAGGRDTVYIPGSSLRGVVRSHCERIARTLLPDCDPPASCDPLYSPKDRSGHRVDRSNGRTVSCGLWLPKNLEQPSATDFYAQSCTICKLFGNTSLASHIRFADAVPPVPDDEGEAEDPNDTEERNGVAIDRVYGSAARGALFQFEVVTRGSFETSIVLQNFTCGHLGLLALTLRDLDEQYVPIGFGKSRGLGRVHVDVAEVRLRRYWVPQETADTELLGFLDNAILKRYKLSDAITGCVDRMAVPVALKSEGGLPQACVTGDGVKELWTNAVAAWASYVEQEGAG